MGVESMPVTGGKITGSHAYEINDTYTVTVTGETSGQIATTPVTITGGTQLPMTAVADTSADPTITVNVTHVDPADTTVTIDWIETNLPDTVAPVTDGDATGTATYTLNAGYTIKITGDVTGTTTTCHATVTGA